MTTPAPAPDFYRLAQVAALLNVSTTEVRRYRDRGELRCVYSGSKCLIPRQSYETLRDRLLAQAGLTPIALPTRGRPRHPAAPAAPREGAG